MELLKNVNETMAVREFQRPRIETHVLKVHVDCHGCKQKVKKLLRKIDGVYSVEIDHEEQLVVVHGAVNPDILIRKLAKSRKHADLWFPEEAGNINRGIQPLFPDHYSTHQNEPFFSFPCETLDDLRLQAAMHGTDHSFPTPTPIQDTIRNYDNLTNFQGYGHYRDNHVSKFPVQGLGRRVYWSTYVQEPNEIQYPTYNDTYYGLDL